MGSSTALCGRVTGLPSNSQPSLNEVTERIDDRTLFHGAQLSFDELTLEEEEDNEGGQGGEHGTDEDHAVVGRVGRRERRDHQGGGLVFVCVVDEQRLEVVVPVGH